MVYMVSLFENGTYAFYREKFDTLNAACERAEEFAMNKRNCGYLYGVCDSKGNLAFTFKRESYWDTDVTEKKVSYRIWDNDGKRIKDV